MKTFLSILFCCLVQTGALAQANSKVYPSEAAMVVSNFLSEVHVQVANHIRSIIQTDVGGNDLQGLLNLLDVETNSIARENIDGKLNLATNQLEDARIQAAQVLKDPQNKLELSLEPEKWLREIALQKAQEGVLLASIAHLRHTVDELLQWSKVINSVMPASQLDEKLKLRMNQLLSEWEKQPNSADFTQVQIGGVTGDEKPGELKTEQTEEAVSPVIDLTPPAEVSIVNSDRTETFPTINNVSPAVADILKLTRAHVPVNVVVTYIISSDQAFGLNHEQIEQLRTNGVSSFVIKAMIQRDKALRSKKARADEQQHEQESATDGHGQYQQADNSSYVPNPATAFVANPVPIQQQTYRYYQTYYYPAYHPPTVRYYYYTYPVVRTYWIAPRWRW